MKKLALLFLLIGIVLMLDSCSEKCQNVYTYKTSVPVFMKKEELLKSVSSMPAKALKNTGKIWIYDKYL
ncbi:MAG: hypothetical protein MUE81_22920, partial [Thermoflexibacter sp.]|nr:hypothetical protein [Thermoflexibacter sp.]